MKRIFQIAGLATALALPLWLSAQSAPDAQNPAPAHDSHTLNHGEIGVYGDLYRVTPKGASAVNFLGLGGRVGFNMGAHAALEAEMNYDFEKNYTTVNISGGTGGGTTTTVVSKLRPLTGLFGPRLQFGTSGPFRAFITGKAGFIEFSYSNNSPSGSTYTTALDEWGNGSTHFAAYPGGGIEAFLGPIGLRAEAGDELWWNSGTTYNNLRVTFGPTIRF